MNARLFRPLLAAVAAAALYYVVVVLVASMLAIALPRTLLGVQHAVLALILSSIFQAVPVAMLVALGAYAIFRWVGGSVLVACVGVLGGMLASFAYWNRGLPLAQLLDLLPWYMVLPKLLAPWLGLALALWFASSGARTAGETPD